METTCTLSIAGCQAVDVFLLGLALRTRWRTTDRVSVVPRPNPVEDFRCLEGGL